MKLIPEIVSLLAAILCFVWSMAESVRAIEQSNNAGWFFATLAIISFIWIIVAWKELKDDNGDDDSSAVA